MPEVKVAIVIGGSRGIGAAIARQLAVQGLDVVVSYVEREREAHAIVDQIEGLGRKGLAIQARQESMEDLDRLFAEVHRVFGRLDVLVNNAGVGASRPFALVDRAFIDAAFATNVTGMLMAAQRAAQAFGRDGGVIVNVSSVVATQPVPGWVVYAASKAAVEAATRVLAQELGPRGIRVNAIAPGPVDTERLGLTDELRSFINSRTALGRVGLPDDISKVVGFLVSDAAAWITGEVIGASGGHRI